MTFHDDHRRQPKPTDHGPGALDTDRVIETRVNAWLRAETRDGDAAALDAERALVRVFERLPRPGPSPDFAVRVARAGRVAVRDAAARKWLMIAAAIIAAVSLPIRLAATWGAVSYLDQVVWVGWLGRLREQVITVLQPVVALARVLGELEPTVRAWLGSPPMLALMSAMVIGALLSLRRLGSSFPGPGAGSRA